MLIYLPLLAVLLIAVAIAALAVVRRSRAEYPDEVLGLRIRTDEAGIPGPQEDTKHQSRPEWARDLTDEQRYGFRRAWQFVRERFGSDPKAAAVLADLLVSDLIRTCDPALHRGKGPPNAFAGHRIKAKYRAAHEATFRNDQGPTDLHELERAMELFQSIFDELLSDSGSTAPSSRELLDFRHGSR